MRAIVLLIVRDSHNLLSTAGVSTTFDDEKGEPKPRIQTKVPLLTRPNALPLGQTRWLIAIEESVRMVAHRVSAFRSSQPEASCYSEAQPEQAEAKRRTR